MAPKVSRTSGEPTLYEILSLTPKQLEGQPASAQAKLVKHAYHKALLKHHPDKKQAADSQAEGSSSSPSSPSSPPPSKPSRATSKPKSKPSSSSSSPNTNTNTNTTKTPQSYTVDQIQSAYNILADAGQRASYARSLRSAPARRDLFDAARHPASWQIGVETVDLDDVDFDERRGLYFRPCRCGSARGYAFTEANLEEFEDDGVVVVECRDCSLWLRVLFAAAVEEEDEEGVVEEQDDSSGRRAKGNVQQQQGGQQQWQQQKQTMNGGGNVNGKGNTNEVGKKGDNNEALARERRGSAQGKGKGWKFNLSFGLSLGGSASASASAGGKGSSGS
ncbi:hypothetical protein F4778DRAFT_715707 [Xylariomycetidae sp. FL2044]|nr:hypothetical protein F4778DRAFT_715707 [Xylariomycetidae sp. FL2044]